MQIGSLKVFCDLVDTASFSIAAQRNTITQSAVSQQIRSLETRYGVSFFERGKKNFSVTREGQVFDRAAREILETFSGIEESLNALRDVVSGKLRIATVYSIGLHQMPKLVERFRLAHPGVQLEVSLHPPEDVVALVEDGLVDIGIVAFPEARHGVVVEEIAREELVVIATPDSEVSGRDYLNVRDLEGHRWIGYSEGVPMQKGIEALFRKAGARMDASTAFDDVETVKRAVLVGGGLAVVPASSVEHEAKSGLLAKIGISDSGAVRPIGTVKKQDRPTSPALREFLALLQEIG